MIDSYNPLVNEMTEDMDAHHEDNSFIIEIDNSKYKCTPTGINGGGGGK